MTTSTRSRTYFDISVDGVNQGRIVFELFNDVTPKTCENFRALCTGEKGNTKSGVPLSYKGCPFHRVIKNFMAQGGDFTNQNGTGGESIYGEKFDDENFEMKHEKAGLLSMANAGPGTNGSQFFILFEPQPHLDGKHVVFGEVHKGMGLVRHMEKLGSSGGETSKKIVIADCGELKEGEDDGMIASDDGVPDWPDDLHGDDKITTTSKKLEVGKKIKDLGNAAFKAKENDKAISKYTKAERYLDIETSDGTDGELDEVKKTKASCLLNRAQATIKMSDKSRWPEIVQDCTAVLDLGDIESGLKEKAYYRRSVAQADDDEKKADLKSVLQINPSNASAKRDLAALKVKYEKQVAAERKAYSKMFS